MKRIIHNIWMLMCIIYWAIKYPEAVAKVIDEILENPHN